MSKKHNNVYLKPEEQDVNQDKVDFLQEPDFTKNDFERDEAAPIEQEKNIDPRDVLSAIPSVYESNKHLTKEPFHSVSTDQLLENPGIIPKPVDTSDKEAQIQEQRKAIRQERLRLRENAKNQLIDSITEQQKNEKAVIMKKDYTLQMGMPGRSELTVTTNLKQGQRITDERTINLLLEDNAPIEIE